MIIKSIELQNFQCYSGEYSQNTFSFEKGINVIIGDNGSGKSKLFDAFYWVLYDRIFDSKSRNFLKTKEVGINLVSDKAKEECKEGEAIEAKVKIVLVDDKGKSYSDEYSLERKFIIIRNRGCENVDDLTSWKLPLKSFESVEKKDVLSFKPDRSENAFERVIAKLLPPDIQPYLWFQGEQVDSLIDFNEEKTLTKAINALSDISYYDKAKRIAEKLRDKARTQYKSEERSLGKKGSERDELFDTRTSLEEKITRDEVDKDKIEEQLAIAESSKEDILGRIEDAQEIERLRAEIESKNRDIDRLKKSIQKSQKKFNSNIFSKRWLLKYAASYCDKFEKKKQEYNAVRDDKRMQHRLMLQKEQQEIIANKHRLPENVPNKVYIDEMLKEKKCFLCNRDFEEHDSAYEYLTQLIEETKAIRVMPKDFLKNDLKGFFDNIYNNAYYIKTNELSDIDGSIKDEISRCQVLEIEKSENIVELKELENKLDHLLRTGSVSTVDSANVVSEFRQFDKSKDRFINNLNEIKVRLKYNQTSLNDVNSKLSVLVEGEIDKFLVQKKSLLEKLYDITENTRNRVYDEQIKKIENEANLHFRNMTSDNKSTRGSIILERTRTGSYMPKNIDSRGIELSSINDSNLILIKLATIMAIVSAKGGGEFYPLITDAPTSKFGDNYTIGFCDSVGKVFSQSIIMSYDFYHNEELKNRLLNNVENLGSVYLIEPNLSESERESRTKLCTNIKRIK